MPPIHHLVNRLARRTLHVPIPKLSTNSRRRLSHLQSRSKPQYSTPYHVQAHSLQMVTALPQVTPIEFFFLLVALGMLASVLCWLAWKFLTHVFQAIREKMDEFNVGKRMKANARRKEQQVEDALENAVKIVKKIGGAAKHMFEGLTKGGGWQEREFGNSNGHDERRGLLQPAEREAIMYGYHGGAVYRNMDSDGTAEIIDGTTAVKHRDDCMGECGETRRRSVDA